MQTTPPLIDHSGLLSSVRGIGFDEIEDIWPRIEPWVSKSCKRGGNKYLASDIKGALLSRDMQLWIAGDIEACAVTEIVDYPQKRYLRIHLGAGEYRKHFKEFIKISEAWAVTHDCSGAEAVTHKIFSTPFKMLGWKFSQIYMEKEL